MHKLTSNHKKFYNQWIDWFAGADVPHKQKKRDKFNLTSFMQTLCDDRKYSKKYTCKYLKKITHNKFQAMILSKCFLRKHENKTKYKTKTI